MPWSQAQLPAIPAGPALPEATRVMQAAMQVEETRFNNINTRAVSLLSATSLVTALAGLFSKELLGQNLGGTKLVVAVCLLLALVLLCATGGVLVFGVLMPGRRVVFGDNTLTEHPETLTEAEHVDAVAFREYVAIWRVLDERNTGKVASLHLAYILYGLTVLAIAVGSAAVAIDAIVR